MTPPALRATSPSEWGGKLRRPSGPPRPPLHHPGCRTAQAISVQVV